MTPHELWQRYRKYLCVCDSIGLRLDVSRMNFPDDLLTRMAGPMDRAFGAMAALEKGAIANPDEKRMVGHYWLRAPKLAPNAEIRKAIEDNLRAIHKFKDDVHSGRVKPQKAGRFRNLLVIGIGGSALGPQFVAEALWSSKDRMTPYFFDNTDPDGFDRTIQRIGDGLKETLTVVISKSGGTKETRNGMLEIARAYGRANLEFSRHAVAVTGENSELDQHAVKDKWRARFPMWDWVGGRTSELAAVGLLPAALQGIDVDAMLDGAAATDEVTRSRDVAKNPAALLALMWHHAGNGHGAKDMVVLPYKDRLLLFSRYLQQLVMESLGKERDLDGKIVNQGIAVYGNKGSTDQHAYVQQLRDGLNNFFITFVQVLKDRSGKSMQLEENVTSGDYLLGFLLGTRRALHEGGRESVTVTVPDVSARSVGILIALYERAVGFYGTLVNVNAYHQPGVEAGKKAAAGVLELQRKILAAMKESKSKGMTAEELAQDLSAPDEVETVFQVLEHMAANSDHGVQRTAGKTFYEAKYRLG